MDFIHAHISKLRVRKIRNFDYILKYLIVFATKKYLLKTDLFSAGLEKRGKYEKNYHIKSTQ